MLGPQTPTNQYHFHKIISRLYLRLLGGRDRPIPFNGSHTFDALVPSRKLREGVPIRDARLREAAGHCWIKLA
jgi:hypothetical protein